MVAQLSGQTLAIALVVVLLGLFLLMLAGALIRSRQAAARFRAAAAGVSPRPEPAAPPRRPTPVSRREFFRRSLLTSLGLFGAQFGAASLAFLWPNLRGGFGSVIELGLTAEEVSRTIEQDQQPYYYGAGRFYLVKYDGDAADSLYSGLVADGIMALYQRCVHLGCRVPFCTQSQWFECPCHGSKYNNAGEYRDGPAPRGMDRFKITAEGGTLQVDTSTTGPVQGPPRGTDTINQEPEGPFCVTITGE